MSYDKSAMAEALRCARLTEWTMAERWPVKATSGRRGDDRPVLAHANANEDATAWSRVYAVGRAPRERLLAETDPNQLTQAAVRTP